VDLTGEEEHPPQVYSLPDPEEKNESDGEETEEDESDGEETEEDESDGEETEEDSPDYEYEVDKIEKAAESKGLKLSEYVKQHVTRRLHLSVQDELVDRAVRNSDYDMIRVCVDAEFPDDSLWDDCYNSEKSEKWGILEAFYDTGRAYDSSNLFVCLLVTKRVDLFCKHIENGGRVNWDRVLDHIILFNKDVDTLRYLTDKYLSKLSVGMITKWVNCAKRDELPDMVEVLLKAKQRKIVLEDNFRY
jgi:hypothetical protein